MRAEPLTRCKLWASSVYHRPFISCGSPGSVIWRSRELHHEQIWTRPLRRRLPGGSLSPGPGPLSPRRGDPASGDPHLRRVRRQHHRCPPGAQLGPLQRLTQRVRRRCLRVPLLRASRCPQSDCPSLSLVPPRALAAPAVGTLESQIDDERGCWNTTTRSISTETPACSSCRNGRNCTCSPPT